MSRTWSIIVSSLLLLAITALTFSSCGVSRKSGTGKKDKPATEQVAEKGDVPPGTGEEAPYGTVTESSVNVIPDEEVPDTGTDVPVGESETEPETPADDPKQQAGTDDPAEDIPYEDIPFEEDSPEETVAVPSEEEVETPEPETLPVIPTGQPEEGGDEEDEYDEFFDPDYDPDQEETAGTYDPNAGSAEDEPKMKIIDYEADIMRPINITDDSTALNLLGNVVFYHNGAVITCDSAVRYGDKRMDFFKRVIINNGTTYVYGDRAVYNGERNTAQVFAPIIKVVDEDAVLYTFRFVFNTLTNIGQYGGGGVLTQNDNHLESIRGFYNTDTREFTAAGEVELVNPEYKLVSDSVRYNLDTEEAEFFTPSQIWNETGEILLADRGKYRNASSDYEFTSNSYILTDQQEIWADTIKHFSLEDYTELRRDIQIIDEENNSMAFGDYGEYWGETEHGMLTLDPSLISYDPEEPADTLYMRSDSMFFYSYDYDHVFFEEKATPADDFPQEELIESTREISPAVMPEGQEILEPGDETPEIQDVTEGVEQETQADGEPEGGPPDTVPDVTTATEDIPGAQAEAQGRKRGRQKETSRTSRRERKAGGTEEVTPVTEEELPTGEAGLILDTEPSTLVEGSGLDPFITVEAESPEDEDGIVSDGEISDAAQDIIEEPEPYVNPYADLSGMLREVLAADSLDNELTDAEFWLRVRDEIVEDSLKRDYYTALLEEALTVNAPDTTVMAVPAGNADEIMGILIAESAAETESALRALQPAEEHDSLQRVFYGYRDVRIFREDFQAVCDSIVGFSKDSTMHLFIDPVMWNDENQVVSDVMVIFTKDEQLYKAEFTGSPFMSSEVDSTRYNQIKGRFMISWFRDNTLYRHDVFGNGQNHYYMQDENTGDIDGFMTVECADITYYIEDNTIDEIVWRTEPVYWIYPIDKIPPEVDEFLPGFKWEAHRRPLSKEEVHNRPIRDRRRAEVLAVPQPTFPITEELNATKERLIQQNMWRDRNDRLSPQALDFIRDMEIKYAEELLELRSE